VFYRSSRNYSKNVTESIVNEKFHSGQSAACQWERRCWTQRKAKEVKSNKFSSHKSASTHLWHKCKATLRKVSISGMHFVISTYRNNSPNWKSTSTQTFIKLKRHQTALRERKETYRWRNKVNDNSSVKTAVNMQYMTL